MQTVSFLKGSFLSNICALLTSFLSWHFPRNSALGDIYTTNLTSSHWANVQTPPVLWGLFGFSNVLCHNNSSLSSPWIQIFVSHGCAHWAQFKGSVQCSGTFQGLQGLSKLWAVPPTAGTSGTDSRAITPQCAPGFPSGAQEEQGSCLGGKKGMRKEIKGKRRVPKRKDQEENEDWNWKFQLLESMTDIRSEPTTAFQHKAAQHGYNLGTLEAEGKKSFHFPKLTISHKW